MKQTMALAVTLLIASSCLAQGSRAGGTSTAAGSGGLTNFGTSGFGSSGFGTSTTGQTSGVGGAGTTGASTFGQGFTFNSGLGLGGNPMGMMGTGGMGRTGFGGMGGLGMMGMGGMGMGGMGMGGRGGNNGRGGAMGGSQQQYQIRPTVKLGFDVVTPNSQQRAQQFSSTISRLPQPERFSGISVKVDGRKAVASGSLKNKADANLLRNLLLMEPGIYEVDISALAGGATSSSTPAQAGMPVLPNSADSSPQ